MKFYRRLQRTKLCSLLKSKNGSVEFLSFIIVLKLYLNDGEEGIVIK